ncbi:class I histocompatibility antigen, F10 alpha chain-like isoform X2 [Pogona vitticeps]
MIVKRFTYRSSHCDVLETADRQFQNGCRMKKMVARSIFAPIPHLLSRQKWQPYGGFLLSAIHVLQCLTNCSLGTDGGVEWLIKCAYDWRDIRLHQDTFPRKALEDIWEMTELWEVYRRESCPQTLCRWLQDGKKYLQEIKTPEVELKAQERDGFKTLFCRAYGFEPVMIRMAWKKDGRDWQAHTFRGIVAPNVDGTYYFWISVRVGPEEEGCYVCRVEHASLAEPLERTWEESASVRQRFGTIVSLVVIAILSLVTTIYCKCFRQEKQTCPQSPVALSQELLDPRETLLGGETQGAQEDREGRPGDHQFCALCGKRYLSSIKKDRRGFSDKDFCSCPPVTLVEILSK